MIGLDFSVPKIHRKSQTEVKLIIDSQEYVISNIELTNYLEDLDYREYKCLINGAAKSIVINCGLKQPYIEIVGDGHYEIDHNTQEKIISAFQTISQSSESLAMK